MRTTLRFPPPGPQPANTRKFIDRLSLLCKRDARCAPVRSSRVEYIIRLSNRSIDRPTDQSLSCRMTVRDKLTLSHPSTAAVNTLNSVVTPGSFPSARSLHNLTVGPTVSPASRVPTNAAMQQQQQQQQQHQDSEAACTFTKAAHAMDKAALSFILSSSDSEYDADEASENGDFSSSSTIAKRKRSVASSTSEAAAPTRKGSKFCSVEGCSSRAKHAKRCWKHGGSVKCKMLDCINRAKSKGVCWSHGGGTVCSFETCDTIAVSHGFCWAHGGGKRCQVPSCSKPAYERTQNYCQTHYDELSGAGTGAV